MPATWKSLVGTPALGLRVLCLVARFVQEGREKESLGTGEPDKLWYFPGTASILWVVWLVGTAAGLLGRSIPLRLVARLCPSADLYSACRPCRQRPCGRGCGALRESDRRVRGPSALQPGTCGSGRGEPSGRLGDRKKARLDGFGLLLTLAGAGIAAFALRLSFNSDVRPGGVAGDRSEGAAIRAGGRAAVPRRPFLALCRRNLEFSARTRAHRSTGEPQGRPVCASRVTQGTKRSGCGGRAALRAVTPYHAKASAVPIAVIENATA